MNDAATLLDLYMAAAGLIGLCAIIAVVAVRAIADWWRKKF